METLNNVTIRVPVESPQWDLDSCWTTPQRPSLEPDSLLGAKSLRVEAKRPKVRAIKTEEPVRVTASTSPPALPSPGTETEMGQVFAPGPPRLSTPEVPTPQPAKEHRFYGTLDERPELDEVAPSFDPADVDVLTSQIEQMLRRDASHAALSLSVSPPPPTTHSPVASSPPPVALPPLTASPPPEDPLPSETPESLPPLRATSPDSPEPKENASQELTAPVSSGAPENKVFSTSPQGLWPL